MNESTIQPELVSLRAKLSEAIEANQKKADLLQKQITKDRELLHAINGSLGIMQAQATGYGAMTDTIRSALKLLDKANFISDDIERVLRANFPTVVMSKKRLRAALWNMVQRHELRVVRQGTTRTPAEYAIDSLLPVQSSGRLETRIRKRPDPNFLAELGGKQGENGK